MIILMSLFRREYSGTVACGILASLFALEGRAQEKNSNSVANVLQARYLESLGNQSLLYNGPQYFDYAAGSKGHQYLGSDQPQTGSVEYEGYTFQGLPLWYDLKQNVLVTLGFGGAIRQRLVSEKLSAFNLGPRRFVRLVQPAGAGNSISTGFYEILYTDNAHLQVLGRYTKVLRNSSNPNDLQKVFLPQDDFFIARGGSYYVVSSLKSTLAVLQDHKKELRQFARAQKLKFKGPTRGAAIAQLVAHYTQLTGSAPQAAQ